MRRSLGLAVLAVSMSVAACSSSPDAPTVSGASISAPANANANSNTGASTSAPDTSDTAGPTETSAAPLTSLPADPAAAIKAFYASAGVTLSDTEAGCIVQSTGPKIVDDLNNALKAGTLDTGTGKALLRAFASCEPSS